MSYGGIMLVDEIISI